MSQLNVDNIRNRTGSNGGPNFPSGITVAVGQTAYIHGNLQVDGTETIINTETLNVADKTVGIGSTSNASNTTADGSGIEVFASSSQTGNNKTLTWSNTSNSWEFGPNNVGLKIGIGVTIYGDTGHGETGIVSATSFKGDGSLLTGIDATSIQTGNTSVQTVDTGSDGHVKMTTEGGERVRVGPAGQIGLGGANYGTSGQVITSAGSGSAPSWADIPPGGNVITAEAEGAIAVGKCVQIRTDGKVEQIGESTQASQPGSPTGPENWVSDGNNDNLAWSTTVVDPDANRALVYFQGVSDRISFTNMEIYEPTTQGGIGNRTQVFTKIGDNNDYTIDNNRHDWGACYDTTNNKHLVVWVDTTSWYPRFSVGSYNSGTSTYSFSTQSIIQSTAVTKVDVVFDSGTGRVILVCRRSDNWYPQCFIGSYNSGTSTYDWSSMTQLSANAMTEDIRVCKAGTTTGQYAVFWRKNSNNYTKSNLITVSSSSNTFTNAGLDGIIDLSAYYFEVAYDANADRINIVYFNNSDSRMYIQRVKRKSGDSGLESDGTAVNVVTQNTGKNIAIIYSPLALRCYTWWRDPTYGGALRWRAVTNTTGTVTLDSETSPPTNPTISSARGLGFPDMFNPKGNIIFTVDASGTNRGQMYSVKTTAEVSNRTVANHYLGFADQAYTDGQTATIKTYGNNTSDLSGLTPGSKYYVQDNGTVATGTDSPNALAGLAISATKLLIMEPKADV